MTGVTKEVAKKRERNAAAKATATAAEKETKSVTKPVASRLPDTSIARKVEVEVTNTVTVDTIEFEFSEAQIKAILCEHVMNTVIPATFKTRRKSVPANFVAEKLQGVVVQYPSQDFVDDGDKVLVTLNFFE